MFLKTPLIFLVYHFLCCKAIVWPERKICTSDMLEENWQIPVIINNIIGTFLAPETPQEWRGYNWFYLPKRMSHSYKLLMLDMLGVLKAEWVVFLVQVKGQGVKFNHPFFLSSEDLLLYLFPITSIFF